jgi:hypothetical protein|tara:strand:+ start:286 stop:627 length:342 start_codon:yes stop_codon:yes gene_type:complete
VCRGWRAAAHDPALWSHAARTRFGLHDFPVDSPGNRDAVRRMVGGRDFAFNYARARWWRAINGVESYRVTLHPPRSSAEIRDAMGVDGQVRVCFWFSDCLPILKSSFLISSPN